VKSHAIPNAALDDRLGWMGTAGSGKTYKSSEAIERVLDRRGRVIISDPLAAWWGLGLLADGVTSGCRSPRSASRALGGGSTRT
jgi:uncharacterized protein